MISSIILTTIAGFALIVLFSTVGDGLGKMLKEKDATLPVVIASVLFLAFTVLMSYFVGAGMFLLANSG